MIPLEGPLSERDFNRRALDVWLRLEREYGEVTRAADERPAPERRRLHFQVELPGFGFSLDGTMTFVERYRRTRLGWELVAYEYDYHREPRPSSRKAHHWHDGMVHAHCDDPRDPRSGRHYRDVPVRLLEAAEEFAAINAAGVVDCSGLFPLD